MHRIKSLLLVVFFTLLSLAVPFQALAVGYGEGSYGVGNYNDGEQPTPSPTSNPGSGSSGSSSSGSSSPSDGRCTAEKPSSAPDLFQINAKANSLTLFFSPVTSNRDRYYISYGTEPGVAQYGFEFTNNDNGVISVDVQALEANKAYYFKVRAGNGCMPGNWSNELAARTGQRFPSYRWSSLPKIVSTGVARRVNPSTVKNVEVDTSTSVQPVEQPAQQESAPAPQPSQPAANNTESSSPTLFGRIGNFFKGLFGK